VAAAGRLLSAGGPVGVIARTSTPRTTTGAASWVSRT